MNLGVISLYSFFSILAGSLAASFVLAFLIRRIKKHFQIRVADRFSIFISAFLIWISLTPLLLTQLHGPLFAAWHKSRNDAIPKAPCLSYAPSFSRLFATFSMSQTDFESWATNHAWKLKPIPATEVNIRDLESFGLSDVASAYSSEMESNGKQLVTFYNDGIVYLVYYAN